MEHLGMVRGKHLDFYVVEHKKSEVLLESAQRSMVDVGEPMETFQRRDGVLDFVQIVHDEIFKMNRQTIINQDARWQVFAWMAEFNASTSDKGGYKVVYSVRFSGTKLAHEHLVEIEEQIYEMQEKVELILKAQFKRISEETGKETFVF